MNRFRAWRESLRRAARWEEAHPGDESLLRLKRLLAAARREDPAADERLWRRLRPRLGPLAGPAPSLAAAVAGLGPRFVLAAGAVCAMLLAGGLYLNQMGAAPAPGGSVALVAALGTPEEAVGGALQARSGDELLRFIAYGPNGR